MKTPNIKIKLADGWKLSVTSLKRGKFLFWAELISPDAASGIGGEANTTIDGAIESLENNVCNGITSENPY